MAKSGGSNKKLLIGAGAAALAVVGGALLLRKKASPDISVSPEMTEALLKTQTASAAAAASALKPSQGLEPLGWFGQLLWHGGACINFSIRYMTSKRYGDHWHLLPQLLAVKDSSGNIDLDWHRDTLMVNRFAEWPYPGFPRCQPLFVAPMKYGPNSYGMNGGTPSQWSDAVDVAVSGSSVVQQVGWPYLQGGRSTEAAQMRVASYRKASAGEWTYDVQDSGIFLLGGENATPQPVYPGKRVVDWAVYTLGNSHLVAGKGLETTFAAISASGGSFARPLWVPPYFRQSSQRLKEWWDRISRWYYNAQWLVWSAEMLRLHCPDTRMLPPPAWWRTHCIAWAIGCPTFEQALKRETYDHREPSLNTDYVPPYLKMAGLVGDDAGMGFKELFEILRLVVTHTPVPGTEGATGQQIVPPGYRRALLDVPDAAGASVTPPIALLDADGAPWWAKYAVLYWAKKTSKFHWITDVLMPIVNSIASIASSASGSALAAAQTAATTLVQQVAYKVATVALQSVGRLSRGEQPFNAGDIVGAIGDAIQISGVTSELDLQQVPPGLWAALKTTGASIPQVPGVDWAQMWPKLQGVQNQLTYLRDVAGWGYLDAAYGGLGLSKGALSAFQKNPPPP